MKQTRNASTTMTLDRIPVHIKLCDSITLKLSVADSVLALVDHVFGDLPDDPDDPMHGIAVILDDLRQKLRTASEDVERLTAMVGGAK